MQTNSNRKGLALGAIFALLLSTFGISAPAVAADAVAGAQIEIRVGAGADDDNFNGVIFEDFPVLSLLKSGVTNTQWADGNVYYEVTKVSGAMDVVLSTYSTAIADGVTASALVSSGADDKDGNASGPSISAVIYSQNTTASAATGVSHTTFSAKVTAGGVSTLSVRAVTGSSGLATSTSPTVVLSIKVWVEDQFNEDGVWQAIEPYTTQTVTLHSAAAIPGTVTLNTPVDGDDVLTVSAAVTTINYGALGGSFYIGMDGNLDHTFVGNADTTQGGEDAVGSTFSAGIAIPTVLKEAAGAMSSSFYVNSTDGITSSAKVAAGLYYITASKTILAYDNGILIATVSKTVAAPEAEALSVTVVADAANVYQQSGVQGTYRARPNTSYTVAVTAYTYSGEINASDSASVAATVTLTMTGTTLTTDGASPKTVSINGGAPTTSYGTVSVAVPAGGSGTVTIETYGFANNDFVTFSAAVGNISTTSTVVAEEISYTVTNTADDVLTPAGTSVALGWSVKDQWDQLSTLTTQRLKLTKGGSGFNYAETISYVTVASGQASYDFLPTPVTYTGSATVRADLQVYSDALRAYIDGSSNTTVNVITSDVANAFSTGLAVSHSGTISYFPDTTSYTAVSGTVVNTGSLVVVSAPGLIFKTDAATTTYSDSINLRAGSGGAYSFSVTSLKAGTFTMTLTNGSDVTTSLLVVPTASQDAGRSIGFDTTNIVPGKTRIVTGTVYDANGNPVATTGDATITVTFAGTAGIPVGSMPTETDVNGNFQVSVLTSAQDSGTFTITAVYNKDGASTATADLVSKVQTITVGAEDSTPSADQKVNAGSFKGYVAIYAKGYEGQRLSAKIGNDWVVVESLASGFERVVDFTGAGYTIAVRIYIDRVLVDTITVTTK